MQVMILTIIGSVLGGGALLKFIEFLINRKDSEKNSEVMKRLNEIENKIDGLDSEFNKRFGALQKEIEQEAANNARVRILTFSEEIQRGHKHSKESFDQIHSDIDDYLIYCNKHPDYPNSRADMAIKNIEDVYLNAMKKESSGKEGFVT